MMTVLALGHPHVKFQLIDNQKTEIQTGVQSQVEFKEQLKDRIASIMGSEFIAGCCPVDVSKDNYSLHGFVGLPAHSRINRTGQYLLSTIVRYFLR